jgi:hypothetical protein
VTINNSTNINKTKSYLSLQIVGCQKSNNKKQHAMSRLGIDTKIGGKIPFYRGKTYFWGLILQ